MDVGLRPSSFGPRDSMTRQDGDVMDIFSKLERMDQCMYANHRNRPSSMQERDQKRPGLGGEIFVFFLLLTETDPDHLNERVLWPIRRLKDVVLQWPRRIPALHLLAPPGTIWKRGERGQSGIWSGKEESWQEWLGSVRQKLRQRQAYCPLLSGFPRSWFGSYEDIAMIKFSCRIFLKEKTSRLDERSTDISNGKAIFRTLLELSTSGICICTCWTREFFNHSTPACLQTHFTVFLEVSLDIPCTRCKNI